MKPVFRFLCLSLLFFLSACMGGPGKEQPASLRLEKAAFEDLPGWGADDFRTFASAFERSCGRILKADPASATGPLAEAGTNQDWQSLCFAFEDVRDRRPENLKAFLEAHLQPWRVLAGNEDTGLFTGYYEASLRGSRTRGGPYQIPLYQRADDLVMVQLGDFREELKGQRIAGRVIDGSLKPYESRAEIVAGRWPHNDKALVWVDNAVDAFFVQIQGSGVVELAEGGTMRIGYAGQNGHPYYAIGRELIKRGVLTQDNVSMQAIRAWLEANPREAAEVMNTNASYVFFRELVEDGPLGGEGVVLTPGRSLAVDRSLLSYGLPLWVDIDPPAPGTHRLQRLMIAQDTGGAITGPVRGDVFWGYGPQAESLAGPMKSAGRAWVLLPRRI